MATFNLILTVVFSIACMFVFGTYSTQKAAAPTGKITTRISKFQKQSTDLLVNSELIFALAILLINIAVRVIMFVDIPGGLNQDEASMGYDAYSTAFYGIDRNGYHLPSYLVAWGSGQSALMMYCTAIFVRIFGLSVFTTRLTSLIFGIATPIIFYLLVRKTTAAAPKETRVKTSLFAFLLLSVSPWHIILSRWGLDCNLLPGVFLAAIYLFIIALEKKKVLYFSLAAGVLALSMYAYATVCIIMPLFILGLFAYLFIKRIVTIRQMLIPSAVFLLVSLPIVCFYVVNLFNLDPIVTPLFSAPRLTVMRSGLDLNTVGENFGEIIGLLTNQNDHCPWNSIEEYGVMYLFLAPFAVAGIVAIIADKSEFMYKKIMLWWFTCGIVLGCLIRSQNHNRMNFVLIPFIYLICEGIIFIAKHLRFSGTVVLATVLIGFVCFQSRYFGNDYKGYMEWVFNYSYEDAITDASERTDQTICVTDKASYALTLFYTQTDPNEFVNTVVYGRTDVEFRPVSSFGRYTFGVPENPTPDMVYVIHNDEIEYFDTNLFEITQYQKFSVAEPR